MFQQEIATWLKQTTGGDLSLLPLAESVAYARMQAELADPQIDMFVSISENEFDAKAKGISQKITYMDNAKKIAPERLDKDGFWVQPTVVAGLDNSSRLAQEEIFGPVLVVIAHDGDDDAVRIANDSAYGLSGSVDSASLERAKAVAARIRTGTLAVNGGVWFSPDAPFGGYKQSGIGREMGVAGFEEYLETKTVAEPA